MTTTPSKATSAIPLFLTNPPVNVTLASDASGNSVTITWSDYPTAASYNLYHASKPDFTNAIKVERITSPYTLKLERPNQDYYFFLTGVVNDEEQRISGDLFSLYREGARLDYVVDLDSIYRTFGAIKQTTGLRPLAALVIPASKFPLGPLKISANSASSNANDLMLRIDITTPQSDGSYMLYLTLADVNHWQWFSRFNWLFKLTFRNNIWSMESLGPADDIGVFTWSGTTLEYTLNNPSAGYYAAIGDSRLLGAATRYPTNLIVNVSDKEVINTQVVNSCLFRIGSRCKKTHH